MNNKRILKNIGVSMLMRPLNILISFLYAPLSLAFLGQEKYGIWAIICNILSWINYFDIGIGNGLRNKLAEAYAMDDQEAAQKYVSTAYFGTVLISAVFGLGILLIWNAFDLATFFNLNIVDENIDIIVGISIIFVCINFVLSLSKTSAYAIQQPAIISITGVLGQAAQLIILYILSRVFQQRLMAVAIMYGVVSLLENILVHSIVTGKRKYLCPTISQISYEHLKPLFTLGIGFFIMQISSLVMNTTDNLLISNLYGSADVTPYNMVYKVFYMFVQIHGIIIMPMWSAYTQAEVQKNMSWIKDTMKKINLLTLGFAVCAVIAIFLFEPFAGIWLGQRLVYGKPLIIIVAVYMIAQMFANNYSSFLCGVGYIKISTIISAIAAILNIPLSIFFARFLNMRLSGIILGSLCMMLISNIALPIVTKKWIQEKTQEWNV